jgi:hypothetical protein
MVQAEGSSKAEALQVHGRTEQRTTNNNNTDKSKADRGCSKSKGRDKFCRYCKIIIIMMIIGSCRTRRKEMVPTNLRINLMVMVRPLLFQVILMVMLWLFLLHVFLEIMNVYLILLLHFIFAVTKTGSIRMSLGSLEIFCVWEMILCVILRALAPFRSRHMMG